MGASPFRLEDWYDANHVSPDNPTQNGASMAQTAYHNLREKLDVDGKNQFCNFQKIDDIHSIVQSCLNQYSEKRSSSKARLWLNQLSSRINYYGNILDVLVQHHPEYVSLAWGTFKFLFVAVQNHESVIAVLAKALARIADALPRVELYTILYPTERIKLAVEELYAHLLGFFDRAMNWCQEGTLLHMWHSFTRPPALHYADIIDRVEELSRRVDQLAVTGSQAEIRAIHKKMDAVLCHIDKTNHPGTSDLLRKMQIQDRLLHEIREQMIAFQTLNSASAVSTNHILTDIQFSNIISSISASSMGDALESFRHHRTVLRFQRHSESDVVRRLVASPQLNKWASSNGSGLILVKGSYNTRHAMYQLFVGIGEQLQESRVPYLMAFRPPPSQTGANPTPASAVDVLKHLTLQVLRTSPNGMTEKSISLTCTQFQTETTTQGWLGLLEASIARVNRPLYVVVDLDVLNVSENTHEDLNWVDALLRIMDHLRQGQLRMQIKVLLGGFGQGMASQMQKLNDACPLVSIPARKSRHARTVAPRGRRGPRGRNWLALRS